MLPPPTLSPAETLVNGKLPGRPSTARKYVLLLIFCLAQFLDAFNNSSLFSAIPALVISLDMTESESTWIISAFQLTFASFLLVSGKISDVYNPKLAFIIGVAGLGIISLGAGFVHDKITLIVLRALCGIAASLTIPSALTLLVNVFTQPLEQARALGVFGGCGAIGNVLGLIIGAIFVEFASWHWVFWFVAIVALPIALICIFLVPTPKRIPSPLETKASRIESLDLPGVSVLTVALILFIFAVTSGSSSGWGSARVIAPLIISIGLIGCFFYWETRLPIERAAVPPRTWFYTNFSVLSAVALLPYLWWTTVFTIFTTLWQDIYHWAVISSAIHMIPIGVLAFAMSFTGPLSRRISPKWIILFGQGILIVATILLAFADGPDKYWPFVFPAFILGSAGAMLTYTHTNIAIFQTAPVEMTGTVGAIFNGALQLGSAVGIAAVSSIETSVEATHGGPTEYQGRAAAFWFLLGIVCAEALAILIFYKVIPPAATSGDFRAGEKDNLGDEPDVKENNETNETNDSMTVDVSQV